MLSSCRPRLAVALSLFALPFLLTSPAPGQPAKKGNSKDVLFRSYDGVELQGTFWSAAGGKTSKEATVILLHHFDVKKGGNRSQDGWDSLGTRLQAEGYAVLSFDFRGFGNSKTVDKSFWNHKQNAWAKRMSSKATESIDHKNFNSQYYPYLVNDVAAARAFLDERNDAGECNTNAIIVIGAGDGAALGALWMHSEMSRRRQKDPTDKISLRPDLVEAPEGRDLAAAVWLTIHPKIGTRAISSLLARWLLDVGGTHKVPMAFVYGKQDASAANLARYYKTQLPLKAKGKLDNTGEKAFDTKLGGSALLQKSLGTEEWIVKGYLDPIMDKRTKKLRYTREVRKNAYFWEVKGGRRIPAKVVGDEAPSVDVAYFMRALP